MVSGWLSQPDIAPWQRVGRRLWEQVKSAAELAEAARKPSKHDDEEVVLRKQVEWDQSQEHEARWKKIATNLGWQVQKNNKSETSFRIVSAPDAEHQFTVSGPGRVSASTSYCWVTYLARETLTWDALSGATGAASTTLSGSPCVRRSRSHLSLEPMIYRWPDWVRTSTLPKGEYGALAAASGATPLRLGPGLDLRLNPLDVGLAGPAEQTGQPGQGEWARARSLSSTSYARRNWLSPTPTVRCGSLPAH